MAANADVDLQYLNKYLQSTLLDNHTSYKFQIEKHTELTNSK